MMKESCPSQCLAKGILSLTSSLEVPEGALHPTVTTGEAMGAHMALRSLLSSRNHSSVKSKTPTPSVKSGAFRKGGGGGC